MPQSPDRRTNLITGAGSGIRPAPRRARQQRSPTPPARRVDHSAGIFEDKPLDEVTGDDLGRLYEVNTIGLFTTTKAALARVPDGGRIINLSSRAYLGSRDHAHYVPSKAAVIGLTRTLAIELGSRQIMVNAIAPGMVRTPMLSGMSEQRLDQIAASYPGGRLPEAQASPTLSRSSPTPPPDTSPDKSSSSPADAPSDSARDPLRAELAHVTGRALPRCGGADRSVALAAQCRTRMTSAKMIVERAKQGGEGSASGRWWDEIERSAVYSGC